MSTQSIRSNTSSDEKGLLIPTPCQPSRRLVVVKVGDEKEIKVGVVLEDFRVSFFTSFLITLLVGFLLTRFFVEEDAKVIIVDVFGSSNVCTYFNFPPSTYVSPFLWIFPMLFGILYSLMSIFRIWIAKEEGKISCCAMVTLNCVHVYVMLSMMWFSTIFAVAPDRSHPETMIVHTLPYANLKTAVCVLQLAVVWFGARVSWVGFELPRYLYQLVGFMFSFKQW